nr:hypothetical protein Iba_chr10cCG11470 [Ipomoea batatas]
MRNAEAGRCGGNGDMETDGGNVVRKKQKMVAKSTKKMMGKGVINASPLESTVDDRASATDYTGGGRPGYSLQSNHSVDGEDLKGGPTLNGSVLGGG